MHMPVATEHTVPSGAKKIWWTELDGLRALAFFLVFYSHTTGLFMRQAPGKNAFLIFLSNLDQRFLQWGWIGVDLFFVMSAFLITSLLLRERLRTNTVSLKNFLMRRVLRIWPLYFTYLALAYFFIQPLVLNLQTQVGIAISPDQIPKATDFWLPFLLFVGNYAIMFQGELVGVINPMWSLCIEEQFYVVWGSLMSLFKRPRHLVYILCAALVVGIAVRASMFQFFPKNYFAIYMNGPARMDSILLGCLAAFFWQSHSDWVKNSKTLQLSLLAVPCILLPCIFAFIPSIENCDPSLIWVMSAVGISWASLLLVALSFAPVQKLFQAPLLVHIGRLTYGMYIFHVASILLSIMFCRIVFHIQSRTAFVGACWLLGLGLTYFMARLSSRYLEAPFLKLKDRFN